MHADNMLWWRLVLRPAKRHERIVRIRLQKNIFREDGRETASGLPSIRADGMSLEDRLDALKR